MQKNTKIYRDDIRKHKRPLSTTKATQPSKQCPITILSAGKQEKSSHETAIEVSFFLSLSVSIIITRAMEIMQLMFTFPFRFPFIFLTLKILEPFRNNHISSSFSPKEMPITSPTSPFLLLNFHCEHNYQLLALCHFSFQLHYLQVHEQEYPHQ